MNEIKEKNKKIDIILYSREYAQFVSMEVDNLREQGKIKLLKFHHRIYQAALRKEQEFEITEEELFELKEFFKIKNIIIKKDLIKGEM